VYWHTQAAFTHASILLTANKMADTFASVFGLIAIVINDATAIMGTLTKLVK